MALALYPNIRGYGSEAHGTYAAENLSQMARKDVKCYSLE